jgi:hypothetical protein
VYHGLRPRTPSRSPTPWPTDLGDDELDVALPGRDVARVADELATILAANDTLAGYHRDRRRALATE